MNSYKFFTKPLTWFMAVLMTATLVGCSDGGGSGESIRPVVSSTTPASGASNVA